ncbi:hypothetical protein MBLNU230_g3644t1 [Neophaeotheca triangularis]
MAAASDKARFYLERTIPDLQELARKQIFTQAEITAITAKRSDFEHTLNARGSKPSDYARYATYETNLDSLRKKRCRRLGVKGSKDYNGQRAVFFILERGTKKFPGDMGLWMQYIEFCKAQKASKKLAQVFTSLLRLKPRVSGLWVVAAKHYAETNGDMATARSYLQRGLRFCCDEIRLYLEYARLEMVHLAKLAARRKILGLDEERKAPEADGQEEGDDMIALPSVTAEDIDPEAGKGVEEVNADALKRLETAPAFTGAIPKAIFDAAMKQFPASPAVAEDFFDLFSTFDTVPSTSSILQYVLTTLQSISPQSAETAVCQAKLALHAIPPTSAAFPPALTLALQTLKTGSKALSNPKEQSRLAEKTVLTLLPYLTNPETENELDTGVRQVLESILKRNVNVLAQAPALSSGIALSSKKALPALIERLGTERRATEVQVIESLSAGKGSGVLAVVPG